MSDDNHARAGPSQDSVPKRDGRYWLEDGNVVLIAGETAFRIYKSLLARQSEVFRDMFSASDLDAGPMFDGCPAVHLSDSAEDLRALLQALMPVERRHIYSEHRAYSFDELAAMVLLGHKYQIEDVQEQALNLLKTFYTDQFDTWEKTLDSRWDPGVLFSIETANPIGAVHLARLLSEPSMLPVAFFGCAVLGSEVLDGWTRQDGSVEYLSPEDTKRAVDGYGELSLDCIPTIDRIFNPTPDPDCMSQDTCQEDLQVLYSFAKLEGKQDLRGMLTSWGIGYGRSSSR
ncbi:hypothetical protein LXA43DRAFT_1111894 [Ganoderma leucocontextum]|nr:hypothetical protein LXA43DRAFT_1111894 [Ganoderma leucocontextum]